MIYKDLYFLILNYIYLEFPSVILLVIDASICSSALQVFSTVAKFMASGEPLPTLLRRFTALLVKHTEQRVHCTEMIFMNYIAMQCNVVKCIAIGCTCYKTCKKFKTIFKDNFHENNLDPKASKYKSQQKLVCK